MNISGLIEKTFRPYKGSVYRIGLAMPEPEYETGTGRRLFTVSQMEKIAVMAMEAEREACAKACDDAAQGWRDSDAEGSEILAYEDSALEYAAAAIRRRSNAEIRGGEAVPLD